VVSQGEVVPGPLLQIGNTTSRVDFHCDPGEWTDAWSASGISHHWALAAGHLLPDLRVTAELLGVDLVEINPSHRATSTTHQNRKAGPNV